MLLYSASSGQNLQHGTFNDHILTMLHAIFCVGTAIKAKMRWMYTDGWMKNICQIHMNCGNSDNGSFTHSSKWIYKHIM